jgi:ribose transport system substrate-binding protein
MRDKKWLVASLIIMALVGYLMSSFIMESNKIRHIVNQLRGETNLTVKDRHIVLIEQEQGHPYWQLVENGAVEAARASNIAIECIGPVRNNMEEQVKLLEKAIASKVDGIIVQGLNDAKFTPVINKAVERGIPVLTIDTDAPASKRLAFVGTDNREAGKRLGELVVRSTGGYGKIGVIIGSESAESQLQRLSGLTSVMEEYKGLQIMDVRSSNISMMEAIQQAVEMLQKHPDITMMVGTSATDALGILQAKKSLGRNDIRIIGFDDLPETLHAIRNGEIEATIVQQPFRMGELSIQLFQQYFQGFSLPSEHFTRAEVLDRNGLTGGKLP